MCFLVWVCNFLVCIDRLSGLVVCRGCSSLRELVMCMMFGSGSGKFGLVIRVSCSLNVSICM